MEMVDYSPPYRKWLLDILLEKARRNSNYSMRAFARDLGIPKTTLSDVLSSKRRLSKKNAEKILKNIRISPKETRQFLDEVLGEQILPVSHIEQLHLEEDEFRLISDWYYLAILNLIKIKDVPSEEEWVASYLGIKNLKVREAINRLIRMGYIEEKDGYFFRTVKPLETTTDITNGAIQKFHTDNFMVARKSLERDSVHDREFSAITMGINKNNIPAAKQLIREFKFKLCDLLEDGDTDEVYTFSMQLYPASLRDKAKDNKYETLH